MVKTGLTRQVDGLGRIVVPAELRRTLDIATGDAVEILVDGSLVVLRKLQTGCVFCGQAEGLLRFHGKDVCDVCRSAMPAVPAGPS